MADKKFNELPAASVITGTELVPVMQGGVTKRANASLFLTEPYDDTEIRQEIAGKANASDLESKQDKLTEGTNISIVGNVISNTYEYDDTSLRTLIGEKADASALAAKQDKLTAGQNITIDPVTNTISATGGGGGSTYEAGENIIIENNTISAIDTKYTAGANILISDDNAISSTTGGGFVNYSEDEQIVGRWIDGKPIYQKTINIGILPNSSSKLIEANYIDSLIFASGIAYNTATIDSDTPGRRQRPIPLPTFDSNAIRIDYQENSIRIVTYARWDNYTSVLTIRYTKLNDEPIENTTVTLAESEEF